MEPAVSQHCLYLVVHLDHTVIRLQMATAYK